ncbi:MAG: lipoprotein [Geothermobacteraceae bacterium]
MLFVRRTLIRSVVLLTCLLLLAGPAAACVGKTLVIGTLESPRQQVLAQLLAVLITERTGTTVQLKSFANVKQRHEALLKHDLDMVIEQTGVASSEILGQKPVEDAEALYQAVKESYNSELNLVWLKPLGFRLDGDAAPVVRKDTLKKFPALARLINKLGGRIDQQAIAQLEQQAAAQPPEQVARLFLKQNRLI